MCTGVCAQIRCDGVRGAEWRKESKGVIVNFSLM